MAQPRKKIPYQRQWPGIGIGPMRVGTEDSIADEPDGQRDDNEAKEERTAEDDQLANQSRPGDERVGGGGQRILQGRAP